jgi:hypothetical protein
MEFNELLAKRGVDPKQVLIMRHAPRHARKLYDALPRLAAEQPVIFNAYQQSQMEKEEGMLKRASYLASFVWSKPGEADFVGLYSVRGYSSIKRDEFNLKPGIKELRALGMEEDGDRWPVLWFDLGPMKEFQDLKFKLSVKWEGGEKAWCRWAARNKFRILQGNGFVRGTPAPVKAKSSAETQRLLTDVQDQLAATDTFDVERKVVDRKEQGLLRVYLIGNKACAPCFVCGEKFPVELLHVAHVKPRAECADDEKRDLNNVVLMCVLGCDALFENRHIGVSGCKVIVHIQKDGLSKRFREFLAFLETRRVSPTLAQSKYFDWHAAQATLAACRPPRSST